MARGEEIPVEQKLEIVLAVLKGKLTVEEAARRYSVSSGAIHRWKQSFIQSGKEGLRYGTKSVRSAREKRLERELYEAKRVIAELTIANQILKKIAEEEEL